MKTAMPGGRRHAASGDGRAGGERRATRHDGGGERPAGQVEREVCRLVDTYADLILRLAYARIGHVHDAQDICQTVLLKLLREVRDGKARFKNAEHEKAWIIRVTINACIDLQKAAWNSRVDSLDESVRHDGTAPVDRPADMSPSLEVPWSTDSEGPQDSELREALEELAPIYREAIYLRYYEGYSIKEIARITGRTTAAIEQHLSRERTKLRDLLEAKGDER